MDLPFGIDLVDEALGQPGVAMLADTGQMVDDFVGSLDLPQSAALMPRLTARIAIRFAAHASRALFGNLLDGRFRQAVARRRHAAVAAGLARVSLEFLDLLRVGEIERFGLGEFPGHRDNQFDQLALGQTTEIVGMMARAFDGTMYAYCSSFVTVCASLQNHCDHFATPPCP